MDFQITGSIANILEGWWENCDGTDVFLLFLLKGLIEKEADCFSPLPMRQSSLAYTIGSEIPLIF